MTDLAQQLDDLDKAATSGPWEPTGNGKVLAWLEPPEDVPGMHPIAETNYNRDLDLVVWLRNHTDEIRAALTGSVYLRGHDHLTARAVAAEGHAKWLQAERDRLREMVNNTLITSERLAKEANELVAERDRLRTTLALVEELAASWDDSVDWSPGRSNYGDNDVYTECARTLRDVLKGGDQG